MDCLERGNGRSAVWETSAFLEHSFTQNQVCIPEYKVRTRAVSYLFFFRAIAVVIADRSPGF